MRHHCIRLAQRLVPTMPPSPAFTSRLRSPSLLAHAAEEGGARTRARSWHHCSRPAAPRSSSRTAAQAYLPGLPTYAPPMEPTWSGPDGQTQPLAQMRTAHFDAALAEADAPPGSAAADAVGAAAVAPPDVRIVDTVSDAEAVVRMLLAQQDTGGAPCYHAVDTEARAPRAAARFLHQF